VQPFNNIFLCFYNKSILKLVTLWLKPGINDDRAAKTALFGQLAGVTEVLGGIILCLVADIIN
jgi:hypothetical protein